MFLRYTYIKKGRSKTWKTAVKQNDTFSRYLLKVAFKGGLNETFFIANIWFTMNTSCRRLPAKLLSSLINTFCHDLALIRDKTFWLRLRFITIWKCLLSSKRLDTVTPLGRLRRFKLETFGLPVLCISWYRFHCGMIKEKSIFSCKICANVWKENQSLTGKSSALPNQ